MSLRYTWWAHLIGKGVRSPTFGKFHLIPEDERFPGMQTIALCGKRGLVVIPQQEEPLRIDQCEKCLRSLIEDWRGVEITGQIKKKLAGTRKNVS